ncbi:hypothetical protein J6590_086906 [Homalodisca vitripennis]|nr:hypothetical protein J6590_086906 [Homalodisca vitripennis]
MPGCCEPVSVRQLEIVSTQPSAHAQARPQEENVSVVKWGKVFQGSGKGSRKPKAQIESRVNLSGLNTNARYHHSPGSK